MADKVANNLVWKFSKEKEYPKSVYRTIDGIVIRDIDSACIFGIDPTDYTVTNKVQFANSTKYASADVFPVVLTFKFLLELTYSGMLTYLYIVPFMLKDDNHVINCIPDTRIREMLADIGNEAIDLIKDRWNTWHLNHFSAADLQLDMRAIRDEEYKKLSWIQKLMKKDDTTEFKNTVKNKLRAHEREEALRFVKLNVLDLGEIIKPLMDKHVYDKINNDKELIEKLENMTAVFSIKYPEI